MKDFSINEVCVIEPKDKNIYLGSKNGKIQKREDTSLQLFKEKNIINIHFYFHFDKSDKHFLIISIKTKKCLGVYNDDKDMKLSLVPLSANANCKWYITIKENVMN